MTGQPRTRTTHNRVAVTLVELLVAIAIIVLLVALLLPALGAAYRTALKSADAALLSQIAMGCEAYNQVFHEYPPSRWSPNIVGPNNHTNADWNVWPPPYAVPQLPITVPTWPANARPRLVGAAKVLAYLSGFNAVGCWDAANVYNWNPAAWAAPCGSLTYRGIVADLNPADGINAEDKVYGPYYNPDEKGQTTTTIWWGTDFAQQRTFASRFARQKQPSVAPNGVAESKAPILYYRANPAPTGGTAPDIFNYADNFPITDIASATAAVDPYNNSVAGMVHPLYAYGNGSADMDFNIPPAQMITEPGSADFGTTRPAAAGTAPTPYNANTFILISPGPDGEYFTADDIRNF